VGVRGWRNKRIARLCGGHARQKIMGHVKNCDGSTGHPW
jgi:hypothetical protein